MPISLNPFNISKKGESSDNKGMTTIEKGEPSILVSETETMEFERRVKEKQGLRALIKAKVFQRESVENKLVSVLSGEGYDEGLEKHPLLDGQQYDGIDNNPSDPSLSPAAKEKIKENQRKQEHEKQLRMQLQLDNKNELRYSSKFNPTPKGP